jgi:hypothetical protein
MAKIISQLKPSINCKGIFIKNPLCITYETKFRNFASYSHINANDPFENDNF